MTPTTSYGAFVLRQRRQSTEERMECMLSLTERQEVIADVRDLLREQTSVPTFWGVVGVTSSTDPVTSVVLQSGWGVQSPKVQRELQVIIQSDVPRGYRVVAKARRCHRSDQGTTHYQKAQTVGFVPGLDDFDALRRMAQEGIALASSWQVEDIAQSGATE